MAIAAGTRAAAAGFTALPSRPAPAGLRTIDDNGGRILAGPIGSANDGAAAFRGGLRRADDYFGNTLTLANVVRSYDGKTMLGIFRARLGTVPVAGLAIAGSDARGNAQTAILFDAPARFPQTMGYLAQRLHTLPPAQSAPADNGRSDAGAVQRAAARVQTSSVRAQDGTVSAQIPRDWQVVKLGEGALIVKGPSGSSVVSGLTISLVDPTTPAGANTLTMARNMGVPLPGFTLPYSDDAARVYVEIGKLFAQAAHKPAPAFHIETTRLIDTQSAMGNTIREVEVTGTQTGGGDPPERYDALLTFGPPGPTGQWTVVARGMVAPTDRYRELAPQMLAIVDGYRYNSDARNAQVEHDAEVGREITARGWASVRAGIAANQQIGAQNQARVDASMASARAVQDGIDRSTAGFVHYLAGTDVVRNTSLGSDAVVTQSASDALTHFDPQHYQSVPVSHYVKGVDY